MNIYLPSQEFDKISLSHQKFNYIKTEQQTKEQHLKIKNPPSFQAKNAKF